MARQRSPSATTLTKAYGIQSDAIRIVALTAAKRVELLKRIEEMREVLSRALPELLRSKQGCAGSQSRSTPEAIRARPMKMPDGQTVGSHVKPTIESWYAGGDMRPLLPAPSKSQ